MKKTIYSAVSIALVATALTPLPVSAATIAFSSLPADKQQAMQNTCNGYIPGNAPFIAEVTALDATVTSMEISRTTTASTPAGTLLSQTPFTLTTGSEHRNGYSPNIFADFTSVATYSGGTLTQDVTTADRVKVTFGCNITKTPGTIDPRGLQVPNDGALFVTYDTNVATTSVTISNPDTTQTLTAEQVVCISPSTTSKGTKADGWRGQNGYPSANCTTAFYLSLRDGAGTYSNSVPDLAPIRPDVADHEEMLPLDSLFSYPLTYDEATESIIS